MLFPNLRAHGVLAAALIALAAPAAHAGWEDAPGVDLTLDSPAALTLSLVEFKSGGDFAMEEGLLGLVRRAKDPSVRATFTRLRPVLALEAKDGDARPTGVALQPAEKVNIRMRNPRREPDLEAVLTLGDRTNPQLVQLRLRMSGSDNLQVVQCKATSRWFPFTFSLGEGGLVVKQLPAAPGAAEKAREEAELKYWDPFLKENMDQSWAWGTGPLKPSGMPGA